MSTLLIIANDLGNRNQLHHYFAENLRRNYRQARVISQAYTLETHDWLDHNTAVAILAGSLFPHGEEGTSLYHLLRRRSGYDTTPLAFASHCAVSRKMVAEWRKTDPNLMHTYPHNHYGHMMDIARFIAPAFRKAEDLVPA